MSSPKRQLFCTTSHDGTTAVELEPRRPPPHIRVDLLLEIFARLDVATVVRCATTSKAVRRAILGDPTIGRRVAANNGAHLLGVSYAISERDNFGDIDFRVRVSFVGIGQAPRHNHLGQFNAGRKLKWSEPVASRGGLIVLRERRSDPRYLFVWNTVTRRILFVPLTTENAATVGGFPNALVTDALLTVGDAGRSFQLLVVTSSLPLPSPSLRRTLMYSKSKEDDSGRWGPVTVITDDLPLELKLTWTRYVPRRRPEALVLGGGTAVHWLHNDSGRCIVRLDIHEARATSIALPPECAHRWVGDGELQLAASMDGKLSLVVAERCGVISMWTLLSAATAPGDGGPARWTRQVVIRREAIARVPIPPTGRCKDMFLGFGELSSTVVLLAHQVGLVRINLRTKEALVLGSDDEFKETEASHGHGLKTIEACLHEIDLPSLLLVMKPY